MAAADVQVVSLATTHWSIVLAGTQRDKPGFREAFGALVVCYRPVIVAFVRAYYPCDEPEAEDITQTFLTRWAENGMSGVAPDRPRFRSYLRGALRHFVQNWRSPGTHRRAFDLFQPRGGGNGNDADDRRRLDDQRIRHRTDCRLAFKVVSFIPCGHRRRSARWVGPQLSGSADPRPRGRPSLLRDHASRGDRRRGGRLRLSALGTSINDIGS